MFSISEVERHFDHDNETVTLTRKEWDAIVEVMRTYAASGTGVRNAERETERVKRIARPLWRACKAVSRQIRACGGSASRSRLQDWEMRLRHATEVDWHDLPPDRKAALAPRR